MYSIKNSTRINKAHTFPTSRRFMFVCLKGKRKIFFIKASFHVTLRGTLCSFGLNFSCHSFFSLFTHFLFGHWKMSERLYLTEKNGNVLLETSMVRLSIHGQGHLLLYEGYLGYFSPFYYLSICLYIYVI